MNYYKLPPNDTPFIHEINDINDIISLSDGSLLWCDIEPYYKKKLWKKVIDKMDLWYCNLMNYINYPEQLSSTELKKIEDIKFYYEQYFNSKSYEYNVYFNQELNLFKSIASKNKLTILAFKSEIDEAMIKFKSYINSKIINERIMYDDKKTQRIKEWGKVFYTCECGVETQRINRSHHEKSVKHINWMKENKPHINTPIRDTNTMWCMQKYTCYCGKVVSNCNKANHEKTKYHKTFKKTPAPTSTPDDNTQENIKMIFTEL